MLLLVVIVQLPGPAPAQQPVTGSVQGLVSRAGTSDPLSKATVEIREDDGNTPPLHTTATESDGRFLIPNVKPGRYRIVVSRPGYVRRTLGVTVVGGQSEDVRAPLMPTAAIFGRVYGTNGEPFGNVDVAALKPSYLDGQRILTAVQSVRTDDRGDYRLFWLPPGRYYVRATHADAQSPAEKVLGSFSAFDGPIRAFGMIKSSVDPAAAEVPAFERALETQPEERYMPVYFPGAIAEQAAVAIDLRPGADAGGVDIPLAPVRARHVRGVVINGATGQAATYAGLNVDGANVPTDLLLRAGPRNALKLDADGSFDLRLFPGRHALMATAGTGVGYATIEVGDADIEGVQIIVMPALNIPGRIVADGPIASADLEDLRISLLPDLPVPTTPARFLRPDNAFYSLPNPDGSFVVEATPGDLRIHIAPILNRSFGLANLPVPPSLQRLYVKSSRLGDVDVLNNGLRLQGPVTGSLEIVIGTTPGAFEGSVLTDGRSAGPGVTVVLLPDVRRRTDLYKTATTDPGGRFQIDRVAPGNYRAFAWQGVSDGDWHDPEFMQTYEPRGARVTIREGATTNTQLLVIPSP